MVPVTSIQEKKSVTTGPTCSLTRGAGIARVDVVAEVVAVVVDVVVATSFETIVCVPTVCVTDLSVSVSTSGLKSLAPKIMYAAIAVTTTRTRNGMICFFSIYMSYTLYGIIACMIEITNITKTYASGFTALRDVNLTIKKGEIFALLGPNGAGKTTLISAICGLVEPSGGTITVGGFDTKKEYRQARSLIGLVPQELFLEIFETVWSTMTYARGFYGKKDDPELYEQILRDLSLWDKKDEKIQALSGGMKRRVLIARALTNEPAVLFLDEPTAGVDVELRREMLDVVKDLQKRGTTVILTTHYIEEAEELADRIGIISAGEIKLVEDKDALMKRMGHKTLSLNLVQNLEKLPVGVQQEGVALSPDGSQIHYSYKTGANSGITTLLSSLKEAGVAFEDLDTEQSSLEEIFVTLINQK